MTPDEEKQAEEARRYVRANQRTFIAKFADLAAHGSVEQPISIFMAGSPGAGKTEFSKRLVEALFEQWGDNPVRIDADEIREMIPGYTGDNSHIFQGASARGVEILYDYVLDHQLNAIVDGTFALKEKGISNIERSLGRGRLVEIYYLFQEPEIAWDFTKKREVIEHRKITKEVFVNAFFAAHDNVVAAKKHFWDKIQLNVVLKDVRDASRYQVNFNATDIDQLVPWEYNESTLMQKLT